MTTDKSSGKSWVSHNGLAGWKLSMTLSYKQGARAAAGAVAAATAGAAAARAHYLRQHLIVDNPSTGVNAAAD
eukprot:CAMPEP_0197593762 /NCGR_PEP_ID=MMETSP1326-20131121/19000_1 /TAXON_ID=1155430 /ORGANISM="Genus nov. species nov., Strain RCC2288" /LENGTH=72 /DNA_ID=CAMNT_0043159801 /DNA_START=108 /DNA_END=325 /DNA_ORIENTATION=-